MEKCAKIEEMILNDNLELDIECESNEEIGKHLSSCEICSALVREIKQVSEKIKGLDRISVSDNFDERLRMKISQLKTEDKKRPPVTVPFFTKFAYYGAGIAAMIIGFFYLSTTGILDSGNGTSPQISPVVQVASADTETETGKTIADSLENLKKNVIDDEDMRMRVSTGE
ncbi:MAG: hypothetical protein JXN63_05710 [Candidatus Delongbacteria bacterium]|nr:hypothetical protein [Candidatus Delongbacteria bacterium]